MGEVAPGATPIPLAVNEADRIRGLHSLGIDYAKADPVLDRVTREMAEHYDTAISVVSLIDVDDQWFMSNYGIDAPGTSRAVAFCTHTIMCSGAFIVPDATADPRFAANPLVLDEPKIRYYAGVPLRVQARVNSSGVTLPLGALCIIDTRPRYDIGDLARLEAAARTVTDRLATGTGWPAQGDQDADGGYLSWVEEGEAVCVYLPGSFTGDGCVQQVHDLLSRTNQRTVRRVRVDLGGCASIDEGGLLALAVLGKACHAAGIAESIGPSALLDPQLRRWGLRTLADTDG